MKTEWLVVGSRGDTLAKGSRRSDATRAYVQRYTPQWTWAQAKRRHRLRLEKVTLLTEDGPVDGNE